MRYVDAIAALVFIAFAALQYNDPDGSLWVALYGFAALVSALFAVGRESKLAIVGLVAYVPAFTILAREIDASWWTSEQAREGLGMLLAALWMIVLIVRERGGSVERPSGRL